MSEKFRKFAWDDRGKWDNFCLKNDSAWFWHTSFRLKHALECSNCLKSRNHSFYLEDGKEIAAIAPLTVDIIRSGQEEIAEMNYGGLMVPAPIVDQRFKKERAEKVLKLIFDEIDRIARDHNVQRLVMRVPLTFSYCKKHTYYNFLVKYGFQDISLNTAIVDLSPDEEDIWSGMSDNHKRAILKARKFLEIKIIDNSNATREAVGDFRDFYARISNKNDLPEERFNLLFEYLKNNMAVMAQARHKEQVVGCAVAVFYKGDAYYLMGANENKFKHCPVAHILHWEIMKYLKRRGILHYELGTQQFGPSAYDQPSPKHVSISHFKRGFGGLILPSFIGEKFYSREYCRTLWEDRIKKYTGCMEQI